MDYTGNDLKFIPDTKSFTDCVSTCRSNSQCVAVRFIIHGCYLKHGIGIETSQKVNGTAGRKCELVTQCATFVPDPFLPNPNPGSYLVFE